MPAPDFARLERRISLDEGFRAAPYKCTAGVWTIGYGHTDTAGPDTPAVSLQQARILLRADIYKALRNCQDLYPNFGELRPVHQEVLVNMCFNLGHAGLGKFHRMNEAVRLCDYETWADEMKDSLWFGQVGARSARLRNAVLAMNPALLTEDQH